MVFRINILSKKAKIAVLAFAIGGLLSTQKANAIGFSELPVSSGTVVLAAVATVIAISICLYVKKQWTRETG